MSLAHAFDTVPGFPLGQPIDGRPRFSMRPEMARLYRWLVANRPHHKPFKFDFRDVAHSLPMHLQSVHSNVEALIDRGWLVSDDDANHLNRRFSFVAPVMHFKEPRHG